MKKSIITAAVAMAAVSCTMKNPLLEESTLPFGAPRFDKIKTEHYLPAFEEGIRQGKADIDAITSNPDEPTFENTIEALELAGSGLNRVCGIFYNLLEADTNEQMQEIAEEISPKMTEYSLYTTLNEPLFKRVKAVWEKRDSLNLDKDQYTLLDDCYKSFERNGANLGEEDKKTYGKLSEQLSLASLKFHKNVLASTNAFCMNLTDSCQLAGLPSFVVDAARETAKSKGQEGWTFDLSYPSYSAFMKYSDCRDLREKINRAYNRRAFEDEFDNSEVCKEIVDLRIRIAQLLGYETYADYALERRMARSVSNVEHLLDELMEPSLPAARKEVAILQEYADSKGFDDKIQSWDFSYWSEKYKNEKYAVSDEELKPYFKLENCINAVFALADSLYGLKFVERNDIPVYHKDVKVYEVKDENGRHMALFYADFFPRESKSNGAWKTAFRGLSVVNGVERRPLVSIVTNFTKPTENSPSLLTHDELTTFLHEFGHALHEILSEGRYESICGTNVARDFVELPSQIMENWAYEREYLASFARHYQTGEVIPAELIDKIVAAKNYHAAYSQVRQLHFGILDMNWHKMTQMSSESTEAIEKASLADFQVLPPVQGTCTSTSFGHIFSGGYSAGYYSYKWAEVLEADAFSLFKEKGIFSKEVAASFRDNILSKGGSEDEAEMYRNFRGHDPEPHALLVKLGIIEN